MTAYSRTRSRSEGSALRVWLRGSLMMFLFFACYPEAEVGGASGSGAGAGAGGQAGGHIEGSSGGGAAGDGGTPEAPGGTEPECGDGLLATEEACDDGNRNDGDGCSSSCVIEHVSGTACGDGERTGQEQCDDGNLQAGDGCDGSCRTEECGNDRVDMGEECDPPFPGRCTANCSLERQNCGDGVHQEDEEQCDDGNERAGDGCFECRIECGDGRIDRSAGEECDPAQSSACGTDCKWLPACGDGIVQAELGEECDPSRGDCVACKRVELPPPPPPRCDGAGGAAGAGDTGGAAGACGPSACVPGPGNELIQNGDFASMAAGWSPHAASVQVNTSGEGVPSPPALEVVLGSSTVRATSGAIQCVPVAPGERYQFRADYLIPGNAPEGVSAHVMAFLYPGNRCAGDFARPVFSGQAGSQREAWTPYQFNIDTSPLLGMGAGSEGRMLLRLGVVAPANSQGSRLLWDGVSLRGRCGNCAVEGSESCDDGNTENADGCSASCQFEVCGDGVRADGEECDDGNAVFGLEGDACTPSCKAPSACDTCSSPKCATEMAGCLGLEGLAQSGPYKGVPRSTLCDRLRSCVTETACNLATRYVGRGTVEEAYLENCYCGTSGPDCFRGQANGSCRAEVEAALETTDPLAIAQRFRGSDPRYPATAALDALLSCENGGQCSTTCKPVPACGDGHVQDRNFTFTFVVDGKDVPCQDDFTHTGRGCSFEECDDANLQPGDGCDEHCFVEACGNRVVQAGEDCDDGNTQSGDGCSAECKAEYQCGNSTVEAPFEECDPPDASPGKLCTEQEYQANSAQCGCDDNCRRAVCGNGVLQRPMEQCEPPGTTTCTDTCQFAEQTPCEECLAADPEYGPPFVEQCSQDQRCLDVLKCAVRNNCPLYEYSDCYCGEGNGGDITCWQDPNFVPEGPCADEMRTGALDPGEEETLENVNAVVIDRLYVLEKSTGFAMLLLTTATHQDPLIGRCRDACVDE